MALSRTVDTPWGVQVPDAYCRVEAVTLQSKASMKAYLRLYATSTGVPAFDEQIVECAYDLEGDNPIAQAYEHLKTLPEFEGAVDC